MVLGEHALRRGIYGPAPAYTCRPRKDGVALESLLTDALDRLPAGIFTASAESRADDDSDDEGRIRAGHRGRWRHHQGRLLPARQGRPADADRGRRAARCRDQGRARAASGILARDAKIIRALLPIRDAVRDVLRAQAADQPWTTAQVRLRIAYSSFVRGFGPINHTVVSVTTDPETGEERETHRRPNLAPFADDPDCWLVASIEDYDLESGLARMGAIFRERVIAPPCRAADRDRGRRARRHPQRDRPRGYRPSGRTAGPRSRDRPRPARRSGVPQSRARRPGRPTTPICRGPSAPSWRSPRRRPSAIRSMRATSRRCGSCSPRTCGRRTSPRGSARRGFPPPTSRRSPPR